MEWRTIESAPKDGTPILTFSEGRQATCLWCEFDWWDMWPFDVEETNWNPSHWMPLPIPPKQNGE